MKSKTLYRSARGFSLIEMLCALVLLSAFAFIATRLFKSTMRIATEAPASQDALTRFESATSAMRQDAWDAASFTTQGNQSLQIRYVDGTTIAWTIDEDGDIVRTAGDAMQRWTGVGKTAVLQIDGPGVILRSNLTKADVAAEVRFISELKLIELDRRPR